MPGVVGVQLVGPDGRVAPGRSSSPGRGSTKVKPAAPAAAAIGGVDPLDHRWIGPRRVRRSDHEDRRSVSGRRLESGQGVRRRPVQLPADRCAESFRLPCTTMTIGLERDGRVDASGIRGLDARGQVPAPADAQFLVTPSPAVPRRAARIPARRSHPLRPSRSRPGRRPRVVTGRAVGHSARRQAKRTDEAEVIGAAQLGVRRRRRLARGRATAVPARTTQQGSDGDPPSGSGHAGRNQQRDALDVRRHREGVERPQGGQAVPRLAEGGDVPGQRGRVAGHVDDGARTGGGEQPAHRLPRAGPRRVEDDDVRRRSELVQQAGQALGVHLALPHLGLRQVGEVRVGGRAGRLVGLDADHAPLRTRRGRQRTAEQPHAGVEVEHRLPRRHLGEPGDRGDQRVRRSRVHLPEAGALDLPVAPARPAARPGATGSSGRSPPGRTTRLDVGCPRRSSRLVVTAPGGVDRRRRRRRHRASAGRARPARPAPR